MYIYIYTCLCKLVWYKGVYQVRWKRKLYRNICGLSWRGGHLEGEKNLFSMGTWGWTHSFHSLWAYVDSSPIEQAEEICESSPMRRAGFLSGLASTHLEGDLHYLSSYLISVWTSEWIHLHPQSNLKSNLIPFTS